MKNIFKLFSVVAVSCFMLAAGCASDDETVKIKVAASPKDGGTVTVDGQSSVTVDKGATVTLLAAPNAGYTFVGWADDNSTTNPRLVTANEDMTYTANFEDASAQSGVNVTFGTSSWDAQYVNAQYNGSAFMVVGAPSESADYPFAKLMVGNAPATGTYNGDAEIMGTSAIEGNTYMHYFESADRGVTLGDNTTGDWWAKDLVVNVSAFDATTATISLVANATMGDVYAITQGTAWENCPTKTMTMTCSNVALTAVKSLKATSRTGKIAKR
jgi:uncharacterized repeat protein (TIGR02543 family)